MVYVAAFIYLVGLVEVPLVGEYLGVVGANDREVRVEFLE